MLPPILMASVAQSAHFLRWALPNFCSENGYSVFSSRQFVCPGKISISIYGNGSRRSCSSSPTFICSASNKPSPSSDISSTAKIRSEVLTPFRSVRMFFYLAFIASGGLGGLIAATQLIAALANPSRAAQVPEILKGLGIDVGAVSILPSCIVERTRLKMHKLLDFQEKKASQILRSALMKRGPFPLAH